MESIESIPEGATLLQLMDLFYDSMPYQDGLPGGVMGFTQPYLDTCYRFFLPNRVIPQGHVEKPSRHMCLDHEYMDHRPHGYMHPKIVSVMPFDEFPAFKVDDNSREIRLLPPTDGRSIAEVCSAALAGLLAAAKKIESPLLDYLRRGWRGECIRVVGAKEDIVIERAGLAYFGICASGSHLNVLTRDASGEIKLWMQRRSMTVKNYPGMLDSCVAGGVTQGLSPRETIVKESYEEAGLDEGLVARLLRPAGVVTHWMFLAADHTLHQPTVNYVYDMEVGQDVVPRITDNEAGGFDLMTMSEVRTNLMAGKIKPAGAAVTIDFLIRHGGLSSDDERDYVQLCQRTHRMWPMPVDAPAKS